MVLSRMFITRSFVLLASFLMATSNVFAKYRTNAEMKRIAGQVLLQNIDKAKPMGRTMELELVKTNDQLAVFNADGYGFVVVNRNDNGRDVLAYSSTNYMEDNMPAGFRWWLDATVEALANGYTRDFQADVLKANATVENFLTTNWNQSDPYNDKCPEVTEGFRKVKAPTGCTATSMAQILNYYKYPAKGKGKGGYYYINSDALGQGIDTIGVEATIDGVYQYDVLKDTYTSDETEKDAISTLMFDCGKSAYMTYTAKESGSTYYWAVRGIANNFQYDPYALELYERVFFDDAEWYDKVKRELIDKRPVMYAALTKKNEGHSFLFTGVNTEGLVWVNWGWSGHYDGWYAIDQLKPDANLDFCVSHQMIIGFKPQPEPDKDEENKSFWGFSEEENFAIRRANKDAKIQQFVLYNFCWRDFNGRFYLVIENLDTNKAYSVFLTETKENGVENSIQQYYGMRFVPENTIKQYYKKATSATIPAGNYRVSIQTQSYGESNLQPVRRSSNKSPYSWFTVDDSGNFEVSNDPPSTGINEVMVDRQYSGASYTLKGVKINSDAPIMSKGLFIRENKIYAK